MSEFTGAQTRVVWLQDAGNSAAVMSERPTLRLMGLDTGDDRWEREILPEIARYSKPLITEDGTRVVFGDLDKTNVQVVNWDGTGLRTLLENAKFKDVWTDPWSREEWVYAQVEEQRGDKTIPVIRRYRMDNPEVSELIWDKMPIYYFTVSGDGRTASCGTGDGGSSPQGIVTLPNGEFHQRANGCWPSMAPDNSLRSWVFTGSHRSIHFAVTTDDAGRGYTYGVDFNPAPGIDFGGRQEFYHPRWSNQVEYVIAGGPFFEWKWTADTLIPDHVAQGVELYVGKFNEDMTAIERWVQVTNNTHGDYWPDVWIKREGPPGWLDSAPVLASAEDDAAPPDPSAQVFLWDTGNDGNQLKNPETGAIRQSNGQFRDAARFARHHVMDLTEGAFVPDSVAEPWLQAVQSGNAFSIEATITSHKAFPDERVILAFADELDEANVALTQQGDSVWLRLRGMETQALSLAQLALDEASHLIVSYAPGRLGVFINGQRVLLSDPPEVPLSAWTNQPVIFGDAWKGGMDWQGLMEGIGLFGREIDHDEAQQRFAHQSIRRTGREEEVETVLVQAKLINTCPAADPGGIAPYKRCLSVQQYEIIKTLEGKIEDKIISVAHWSVLDGKVVDEYLKYQRGEIYELALENWMNRPEQESERMIAGDFEEVGGLYYEVRKPETNQPQEALEVPLTVEAEWNPVAGRDGLYRLSAPVFITGQKNPDLFSLDPQHQFDVAGHDITIENNTIGEVVNPTTLRLGGAGELKGFTVLTGGSGFSRMPAVEIEGGGGTGGEALALGSVKGITLAKLGEGHTSPPAIHFSRPDVFGGRQALAETEINETAGTISRIKITDPGSGYIRAPRVTIEGGTEGVATLEVTEIFVLNGGSEYQKAPTIALAGDGEGAEAVAHLQRTVLRYTDSDAEAFIENVGTLYQESAAIYFDWAATEDKTGRRGIANTGKWVLRDEATIHFGSSTGRPFWRLDMSNAGTLQLVDGARIGLADMENLGTIEMGAETVLGQVDYSNSDSTLTNSGVFQVAGSTAEAPSLFGLAHPGRTGVRKVENGSADAATQARFEVGNGEAPGFFRVIGGQVEFNNHPESELLIHPQGALSLITNDNGGRHRFERRTAVLNNAGAFLFGGRLQVQGNHTNITGITNSGEMEIQGTTGIERLESSTGAGAVYIADRNSSLVINLPGGRIFGTGDLTYINSTGDKEGRYLRLLNLGEMVPGGSQPGRLSFSNVNVLFGAEAFKATESNEDAPLQGSGQLTILMEGPATHSSIHIAGEEDFGHFILTEGVSNTLNIVTGGRPLPRGNFRIVTAQAISGTFTDLHLNGSPTTAYTLNYLDDGIEVVAP